MIDLDIKGFFDNLDHSIMLGIVEQYATEKWVRLYIERWLKVPGEESDGLIVERSKGTPQGGVISPLLANLYLDEAFDRWMAEQFPALAFERYADVSSCTATQRNRPSMRCNAYGAGLRNTGWSYILRRRESSTARISTGQTNMNHTSFTFLGYEYRPRLSRGKKGNVFVGFTPAVSPKVKKSMSQTIRQWRLASLTPLTLAEIAERINPAVRGWMNYFGAYRRTGLWPILRQVELALARWAGRKYKKLHRRLTAGTHLLRALRRREPTLFAHWSWSLQKAGQ